MSLLDDQHLRIDANIRVVDVSDYTGSEDQGWHVCDCSGADCGVATTRAEAVRMMSFVALKARANLPLQVLAPDGTPTGDRIG
jgi:hypothetical protein